VGIMIYPAFKVLHIFFVTAWMVVLFYLPRLFVYHKKNLGASEISSTFKVMEAKLMGVIGNLACCAVWLLVYV
jgi:putative membrane protein